MRGVWLPETQSLNKTVTLAKVDVFELFASTNYKSTITNIRSTSNIKNATGKEMELGSDFKFDSALSMGSIMSPKC